MGYKILSKKELCPNQYEITIEAPYVVRNAKPGQFKEQKKTGKEVRLQLLMLIKKQAH